MRRRLSSRSRGSLLGTVIIGLGALAAWWLYAAPADSLDRAGPVIIAFGVAGIVFVAGIVVGRAAARSGGDAGSGGPGGGGEPRPEAPPPDDVDDVDDEFWRIVNRESMSRQ